MEENIKKNLKSKNPNFEQSLDFILSGGDYSAFLERKNEENDTETQETVIPVFSIKK